MAKFSIIHNLEHLGETDRFEYLRQASEYFGLDPDLNALDTIWMSDEATGFKKLVVYARRGTTDILRDIHQIEILDLIQYDGPGYVGFKATGKNKHGRREIAIGTHSIEGLKGEKLSHAVMTAQTRSLRRLTLQFVGGGILDVSEVSPQIADISQVWSSLAELSGSRMVIPPNPVNQPGKDITPDIQPAETKPEKSEVKIDQQVETEEQPDIKPDTKPDTGAVRKRAYRKRNQVDLASPGQEPVQLDADGKFTPIEEIGICPEVPKQILELATEILVESKTLEKIQLTSVGISPEKKAEYKKRLAEYSSGILPKAGMVATEGIGGCTVKLRKFAQVHTGAKEDLSEQQFKDLCEFLDGYLKSNGPQELVKYIHQAIGVKDEDQSN